MKTTKSRSSSRIATFLSVLLAVVLVAGCTPKTVPIEGPDVSALMLTNVTSSAYDTVPFMWNVRQNTLQSTGTPVLHANNTNGEAVLRWRSGSPLLAVQQWSYKDKLPLMTSMSKDLSLLVPPVEMQSAVHTRWYVPEEKAFVAIGAQNGTVITMTEQSIASGSRAQTLTVPVPSGLQPDVLYGSGSIADGFVLFEAPQDKAFTKPFSLWLLRISNGTTSWVRCGDASAFDGGFFAGQGPSFARVGSLLYFTHSHTKIGCIDTAAASPSVTFPEKINTLLTKLYSNGPHETVGGPLQAQLASDGGTLIIEYPDVNGNGIYYAVNASGTVLGSLRADKTSVTSFDANGKQGFSLPRQNAAGWISLPSLDLFQADINIF